MLNIIDCTLRDGGFYTNWVFDDDLVYDYLETISKIPEIDYIELGYRKPMRNIKFGVFGNIKDNDILKLNFPKNKKSVVIINSHDFANLEELDKEFCDACDSPVDFVRVACYQKDIDRTVLYLQRLIEKGYDVAFNMMRGDVFDFDLAVSRISVIKSSKLKVIYFADTFGIMGSDEASSHVLKLNKLLEGTLYNIGVHMHNNLSLAFKNTQAGIKSGALWCDVTVFGMGRGAGNCATELMISGKPLDRLISKYFKGLQSRHKWNTNELYVFSAKNKIHPTYAQILTEKNLMNKQGLDVLKTILNSNTADVFDKKIIDSLVKE